MTHTARKWSEAQKSSRVRRTVDVTSRTQIDRLAIFIRGGGSDGAFPTIGSYCRVPSRAVCRCLRFVAGVGYAELGRAGVHAVGCRYKLSVDTAGE
jgi:hypothetical protein